MRTPALLERFPRPPWWRPDPDLPWPNDALVLPENADASYPLLASEFRIWREELEQRFRRLDHDAQLLQQRFWRQQVALILGGLAATIIGACQAALGGGQPGLAAAQAVLAGLLTGLAALVRGGRAQRDYLTSRLKAERIKSEFFLFLGRAGDYSGADPEERLRRQVEDIADAEEVG